jgi:Holliday junction resolvase
MVDSREKGARAETAAKGLLIKHTGFGWERVPSSGALNPRHKLKGDLYIPEKQNIYSVEVKHYKEDHISSKMLTDKQPQIIKWWEQSIRQAEQISKKPLLIFKFDRSKFFVAFLEPKPSKALKYIKYNNSHIFYIAKLEEWLEKEKPNFIGD